MADRQQVFFGGEKNYGISTIHFGYRPLVFFNSLATSLSSIYPLVGGRIHGHCASLATEAF